MWLLIVPVLIVFFLIFAAVSVTAGIIGLVGSGWPWLLIGLGTWMLWRGDGRRFRGRRRAWGCNSRPLTQAQAVPQAHASTQPAQADAKRAASATPRPMQQPELPIDLQVKVEQIRRKVDVLLSYADRFPPFSQDLYLVRQTASEYLPRTINAYLALPSETISKPVGTAGRTAHQELKAQLDLLDSKLDDIAQDLQRQDTDRLLANRRFLESRFGMREGKPIFEGAPGTGAA
jgi:hypothetical protein